LIVTLIEFADANCVVTLLPDATATKDRANIKMDRSSGVLMGIFLSAQGQTLSAFVCVKWQTRPRTPRRETAPIRPSEVREESWDSRGKDSDH